MTIKTEELQEIETLVAAAKADASPYAALRQKFPHLAWSRCDSSDVLEAPFRSFEAYDLHLLDVSDHCPTVVVDMDAATGFILATRSPGK
jgi:hypothetical protein